nr:hypothetical protein CFP56_41255 [Quercus suber]
MHHARKVYMCALSLRDHLPNVPRHHAGSRPKQAQSVEMLQMSTNALIHQRLCTGMSSSRFEQDVSMTRQYFGQLGSHVNGAERVLQSLCCDSETIPRSTRKRWQGLKEGLDIEMPHETTSYRLACSVEISYEQKRLDDG